jgi:hypothetical protein
MFDCETLSTRPNALILQLAALPFDPDAPLSEPCHGAAAFDVYLDWSKWEIEANACHIDIGTVQWWLKQSDAAQDRLTLGVPRLDAMKAADELAWFMKEQLLPNAEVWSYGATADIVWVRHFLRIAGYPEPWSYRNERCLRTISAEAHGVPATVLAQTPHDALSDAVAQANWLREYRAGRRTIRSLGPASEGKMLVEVVGYGKPNYVLALGGDS